MGEVPLEYSTLCRIFVLGDARLILGLKNAAAIDAIIAKSADERMTFVPDLPHIYEDTPGGPTLRKLAADPMLPTSADLKGLRGPIAPCE